MKFQIRKFHALFDGENLIMRPAELMGHRELSNREHGSMMKIAMLSAEQGAFGSVDLTGRPLKYVGPRTIASLINKGYLEEVRDA